eukprot:TRINITY_DN2662_c0_g1_i5.p1 TRINITY_DN2662_c0_g1~~TRINITY_DN2662_c0_g1_i5.p1  ORF type:complete len:137 (+),score=28.70 TRINITY_DN2662_c0_g1_i5:10-420(+)
MHRSLTLLIYVFLPVLVAVSVVRVSLIFFCVLFIDIQVFFFFFLMIRRPPRSTHCISSAASDVYKRQVSTQSTWGQLAQLVEQRIENPRVRGSIPRLATKFKRLPNLREPFSFVKKKEKNSKSCLLYTSPSPRDQA